MRGLKFQIANALLMILTLAAVVSAVINFNQQSFRPPDDGAAWTERGSEVQALDVAAGSPAEKRESRSGDVIVKINSAPIEKGTDVTKALVRLERGTRQPTW